MENKWHGHSAELEGNQKSNDNKELIEIINIIFEAILEKLKELDQKNPLAKTETWISTSLPTVALCSVDNISVFISNFQHLQFFIVKSSRTADCCNLTPYDSISNPLIKANLPFAFIDFCSKTFMSFEYHHLINVLIYPFCAKIDIFIFLTNLLYFTSIFFKFIHLVCIP